MATHTTKPLLLVVASDLHCGSRLGLCPPGLTDTLGSPVTTNAFQDWLWANWQHALRWLPTVLRGDPFDLLLNGDLIEGVHHGGRQIISEDIGVHIAAAGEAIRSFGTKPNRIHVVIGTEVHTGNAEYDLGKGFKASVDPQTGKHAHTHLRLQMAGRLISATHHCSATSRQWLESGEYSRAMANERLACLRSGWRAPDIIIRAHRHVSGYFTDNVSAMLVTGAWQVGTRHVHKVVPASIPMWTMSVLDFRAVGDGDLPAIHTIRFLPHEPKTC